MQTFALYVADTPGVLNRVVSLFRRRAVNIVSLTVGGTERPGVSRMTIMVDADDGGARQMALHLRKLVPVLKVANISQADGVARDLVLLKVCADRDQRPRVIEIANVFRTRIVDVGPETVIIEATGQQTKIDRLVEVLCPFGILEMARTGSVVMSRDAPPALRAAPDSQGDGFPVTVPQ